MNNHEQQGGGTATIPSVEAFNYYPPGSEPRYFPPLDHAGIRADLKYALEHADLPLGKGGVSLLSIISCVASVSALVILISDRLF